MIKQDSDRFIVDDRLFEAQLAARDKKIERLTARIKELKSDLKATKANKQVLVDANKSLLVRIAEASRCLRPKP
jgi:hypothetical protein